jgi:hypothetical protein
MAIQATGAALSAILDEALEAEFFAGEKGRERGGSGDDAGQMAAARALLRRGAREAMEAQQFEELLQSEVQLFVARLFVGLFPLPCVVLCHGVHSSRGCDARWTSPG